MEDLLMALLECGSMDLSIIEDVGYDLGEIAEELKSEGLKISLNAITDMIFLKGQSELMEAVEDAIHDMEDQQTDLGDSEEDEEEYDRLQEEIDELESLEPDEDVAWYCNCIDTSIWFSNNEEIYRKYLADAIGDIEDNMGFEF